MTRIIEEQLSALLDSELPAEQEELLLRRLSSEPALREKLARFGLIGELMRDASTPTSLISALSISERVSAAIDADGMVDQSAVTSLLPSSVGSGLAGAGIAASIALMVMFNLADIGNAALKPVLNPVAQSAQIAHDDRVEMAVDPARLTRYLVSHAQFSNSASRQLFNSHVAMAAHVPADWAGHE